MNQFDHNFLSKCVNGLQDPVSSLDEKMIAMRSLRKLIDTSNLPSIYYRKNINQLILDNALHIILRDEEQMVNKTKNQMVRSELYLMLVDLLKSPALFGPIMANKPQLSSSSPNQYSSDVNRNDESAVLSFHNDNDSTDFRDEIFTTMIPNQLHPEQNESPEINGQKSVTNRLPKTKKISNDNSSDRKIFENPFKKLSKIKYSSKMWKPRTSVLFNDTKIVESFVPGIDPTNFFDQDRKLGYQKSRMWFPSNYLPSDSSMLPMSRSIMIKNDKSIDTKRVLEEYKQMRALVSYLGDLVDPIQETNDSVGKIKSNAKLPIQKDFNLNSNLNSNSSLKNKAKMALQSSRYNEVMQATLKIWSPLSGLHLPKTWKKETKLLSQAVTVLAKRNLQRNEDSLIFHAFRDGTTTKRKRDEKVLLNVEDDSLAPSDSEDSNSQSEEEISVDSSPIGFMRSVHEANDQYHKQPKRNEAMKRSRVTSFEPNGDIPFAFDPNVYSKGMKEEKRIDFSKTTLSSSFQMSKNKYSPYSIRTIMRKRKNITPGSKGKTDELSNRNKLLKLVTSYEMEDITTNPTSFTHEQNIRKEVREYQRKIREQIEMQRLNLHESVNYYQSLLKLTMNSQYKNLPSKFILLIEGKRANSRNLIAKVMFTFVKVRRLNFLALAFGVWKIFLVEKEFKKLQPLYSKKASGQLFLILFKKLLKKWILARLRWWRTVVTWIIFSERFDASLQIQTIARRWRDRRRLQRLHATGHYNGLLSDIYLAPDRNGQNGSGLVYYRISSKIRNERRSYWMAAIKIQTRFRCWIQSRDYLYRRKKLLLIQSVIRMFPKYRQYRRLKATTIKCQAWARRTIHTKRYKKMKIVVVILQKYVRRYLNILLKWRIFRHIWRNEELRLAAIISLQCRLREKLAKKRIKALKFRLKLREWASLVIQRNWYRCKRAWHTFLLMCCYRVREIEEDEFTLYCKNKGRFYASRKIQRLYRKRFFDRIVQMIIKVQKWFRGILGFAKGQQARQRRWASRKLHHWARSKMRYKHSLIRRIQSWWWNLKKGRLLKHLWHIAEKRDLLEDKIRRIRQNKAAIKIQSHVNGIWTRRWVRNYKAARIIQRAARTFLRRKHLKNWRRERSLKVIRTYVTSFIQKALKKHTTFLVRLHHRLMIKPQARIRGMLVRVVLKRARELRLRRAAAANRIQKYWKNRSGVLKAIEVMQSMIRMHHNPFKTCDNIHEIILLCRERSKQLYHHLDPRIGISVSTLLYRLGALDLIRIFPVGIYKNAVDLSNLKLVDMINLYENWRKEEELIRLQKNKKKGIKENPKQKNPKRVSPPTELLQSILDVVNVPIMPIPIEKNKKQYEKIQTIMSLPEALSTESFASYVQRHFLKKFSKHLRTRAANLAKDITELCWNDYNNFRGLGSSIITKAQVLKAIQTAPESTVVLTTLQGIRNERTESQIIEERKWDRERVTKCVELLQMAVDRIRLLLDNCRERNLERWLQKHQDLESKRGSYYIQLQIEDEFSKHYGRKLLTVLHKAEDRVSALRRRFKFLAKKLKFERLIVVNNFKGRQPSSMEGSVASQLSLSSATKGSTTTLRTSQTMVSTLAPLQSNNKLVNDTQSIISNAPSNITNPPLPTVGYSVYHTVDLPFNGTEDDINLELNVSICKIYLETLDQLFISTCGIQNLKNGWTNKAMKRAIAKEKLRLFLDKATKDYFDSLQKNHVKNVWNRFRKIEAINQRTNKIIQSIRNKRQALLLNLMTIPRYGWNEAVDEEFNRKWVYNAFVKKGKNFPDPRVDMPSYDMKDWLAVQSIQRRYRKYQMGKAAYQMKKNEESLIEIEATALDVENEIQQTIQQKKIVRVVLNILSKTEKLSTKSDQHPSRPSSLTSTVRHSLPTLESLLPWRCRFEEYPVIRTGIWALLKHHQPDNTIKYDIVVLYRVRPSEGLCDARKVQGKRYPNVSMKRVFQMNLDVGTQVESRFRGRKLFYRSTIVKLSTMVTQGVLETVYSVLYEDGEREDNVSRDFIRPSYQTLTRFLDERANLLPNLEGRYKRMLHYSMLKQERISAEEGKEDKAIAMHALLTNSTASQISANAVKHLDGRPGSMEGKQRVLGNKANKNNNAHEEDSISNSTSVFEPNDTIGKILADEENNYESIDQETTTSATSIDSVESNDDIAEDGNASRLSTPFSTETHLGTPNTKTRYEIRVRVSYRGVPLRINWREDRDLSDDENSLQYVNKQTMERIEGTIPTYFAFEIVAARRIQLQWFIYRSKMRYKKVLMSRNISSIIQEAIQKASKIGFIGYRLEGVTAMQILRRAGLWEVADIIESYYRTNKHNLSNISIEQLISKTKDDYWSLGLVQTVHLRLFRDFQNWWKSFPSESEREKALDFFNYYVHPYDDSRSIVQCIKDSEDVLIQKFTKFLPSGASRTRVACQAIVKESRFPHTHLQIANYLKQFKEKPEQAREGITQLINKPTTHTWMEERQVMDVFGNAVRVVGSVLANLKLKRLRKLVTDAERRSNEVRKFIPKSKRGRPLCSGPEAKVALILRQEALQLVKRWESAAVSIQRIMRGCMLHYRFQQFNEKRKKAMNVLQRSSRRFLAYKEAIKLKNQQLSEWEQLWDSDRNTIYYFNNIFGFSQYDEPTAPYRPLVRDRLSVSLVQAWPHLDSNRLNGFTPMIPPSTAGKSTALTVTSNSTIATLQLCGICNARRCVRMCEDCGFKDDQNSVASPFSKSQGYPLNAVPNQPFPYCFPCYMNSHNENSGKTDHRFHLPLPVSTLSLKSVNPNSSIGYGMGIAETKAPTDGLVLKCSCCDKFATRKCIGLFTDREVEELCGKLRRVDSSQWLDILRNSNFAGDRKLTLLMEQFMSASQSIGELSSISLEVSTLVRKDEGGSSHGVPLSVDKNTLAAATDQQLQDIRTILLRSRTECDDCYCETCYIDAHKGGKRALHKWIGFQPSCPVCAICMTSPAEMNCVQCESPYCNSCYNVFHGSGRKRRHRAEKVLEELRGDQVYCMVCQRQAAATACHNDDCKTICCETCYLFEHKATCDHNRIDNKNRNTKRHMTKNSSTVTEVCVSCEEIADRKCHQCNDYYCSVTVGSNGLGCFEQFHSKGHRQEHAFSVLVKPKSIAQLAREKSRKEMKKNRSERKMLIS